MQVEFRRTSPLFMGMGDMSAARCFELHQRLFEALSDLDSIQQGMPDPHGEIQLKLHQTARDLFEALTGYRLAHLSIIKLMNDAEKQHDQVQETTAVAGGSVAAASDAP